MVIVIVTVWPVGRRSSAARSAARPLTHGAGVRGHGSGSRTDLFAHERATLKARAAAQVAGHPDVATDVARGVGVVNRRYG